MDRMREHQMPSGETEPAREAADAPKSTAPYSTVDTPKRLRTTIVVLVLAIVISCALVLLLVAG